MRTKCKWEIREISGEILGSKIVETEYEDPIFMNMQFCVEREQFIKLQEICNEYKLTGIHEALQDLLNDEDPYKLVEQYM